MNARYGEFRSELRAVQVLEKLASADDVDLSETAQIKLAETCDGLFEQIKTASSELTVSTDLPRKEAAAVQVVDYLLSLTSSRQAAGQKTANTLEDITQLSSKLATAVFLDGVLTEQLTKLSGQDANAARMVQLLGREYAVGLMQGFLT